MSGISRGGNDLMARVHLEKVSKLYPGNVKAVDSVDLAIADQEFVVLVGRSIVREPAAFLFDEPLSNLDAKLRVTTRAELKRLHHRLKTTTIYVTHDQEEAMTLGDRIVAMKEGKIQQADTPLA